MKKALVFVLFGCAAVGLVGCGANKEPDGYAKTDFAKRPRPPGYGPPPVAGSPGPAPTSTP